MATESRPEPPGTANNGLTGLLDRMHPVVAALAGATSTSSSGAFVKLSGVNAGTAAFLRCFLALFALVPMAIAEYRKVGPRPARLLLMDVAAGLLLGVDYVLWSQSIQDVGASIATILINIQVIVFPLLVRIFSGTRLPGPFILAAPVMLIGVALAGGAIGSAEPGSSPVSGAVYGTAAGVAFAGYLFLSRLGGGTRHSVLPVCTSTAAAAVSALVLGSVWTGIDLDLGWNQWAWMAALAVFGQVLAWLLVGSALPRLAPSTGAALLLLQPVQGVVIGIALLGERPTATQILGCVLVVLAVWVSGRSARRPRQPAASNDPR
ncbi:threonine/homoserine efflux transporter RhtA [Murinocardiopsis flavida]|uniref:Threonine/homoserine efflux transporter RhtA n=1 Tax=Murinocardiopsis flavida TaxID=645275 RepID=A0A2P8DTT5_9ACTN|nr:DMT family transporter [Murinocardiopsis flavida]PSL00613.1 threonine/homoserine efflux transporter RhtA [Murinocardiopsis flavida]